MEIKSVAARVITLAAFILASCNVYKNSSNFTIQLISNRFENIQLSETEFITVSDSIIMATNDSYVIIELPIYNIISEEKIDRDGSTSSEIADTTVTHSYFIYEKESERGFLYRNLEPDRRVPPRSVDSFLVDYAYKNSAYENISQLELVNTQLKGPLEIDVYTALKQGVGFDTLYYYFDNSLRELSYSFSTKLDSMRNSKLARMRYVFNQQGNPSSPGFKPRREFEIVLKNIRYPNENKLTNFIKKHETLIAKEN